jgi:Ca2+-binding RTX toxin-like protein
MELVAYNSLGRGLDMRGFVNGVGIVVADSSVETTFLGSLDDYTLAYSVYGAPWSYMTITGSATFEPVLQQYTGELNLTALGYYAADGLTSMVTMSDMDVYTNLYDLGTVNIASLYTGDDFLWGNDYVDYLQGGPGADVLWGEGGNDVLNGESGADIMLGGAGNDTYYVDNAYDLVDEPRGTNIDPGGSDRVYAAVSWTLDRYIENLTLTGTGNLYGNGNSLRNTLVGNAGNNALRGAGGDDVLSGGAGFDLLAGDLGRDALNGGSGTDIFAFNTKPSVNNLDVVKDYSLRDDFIGLDDDIFQKFVGSADGKTIGSANYRIGAAALDTNDYLVYNPATDLLSYDADGSGRIAALPIATIVLSGNRAPAWSDYIVFS